MRDSFRICATCRHLRVVEQRREFEQIIDTEYVVFHCDAFGVTTREDFLMAPPVSDLPDRDSRPPCPRWEAIRVPAEG